GGAKGAGQLGMMKYVYEKGIRPDFISGISVGSLNATMWAQEENIDLLESLWRGMRKNSDIYKKNWWKPWKLCKSLYDNTPLKRKINEYVDTQKLKNSPIDLKIGVVQLQSGEYSIIDKSHSNYKSMLLSSTSIPVVFPAVTLEGNQYVDGGVRNVAPLKSAIDYGCTKIYLLHCFPLEMDEQKKTFKNTARIGIRSFWIMYNEILREDIKTCQQINKDIEEGRSDPEKNYRAIDLIIVAPTPERQFGDILEFSPSQITRDIDLGYQIAKEILGNDN
ncbi:MAG: patatin-like phospholipase family protein, partial [bacterium]